VGKLTPQRKKGKQNRYGLEKGIEGKRYEEIEKSCNIKEEPSERCRYASQAKGSREKGVVAVTGGESAGKQEGSKGKWQGKTFFGREGGSKVLRVGVLWKKTDVKDSTEKDRSFGPGSVATYRPNCENVRQKMFEQKEKNQKLRQHCRLGRRPGPGGLRGRGKSGPRLAKKKEQRLWCEKK